MNKHKYVIYDCDGLPVVHIFTAFLDHKKTFDAQRQAIPQDLECAEKPIGAGLCCLEDGRWKTEGGSWSLDTQATTEDAMIINKAFGLEG